MKQRGKDRRRFPRAGSERRMAKYRAHGSNFKSWLGSHDWVVWALITPPVVLVILLFSTIAKY